MGNMQFDRQTVIRATTSKKMVLIEGNSMDSMPPYTYERYTILSEKNTISRCYNLIFGFDKPNQINTGVRDCIIDSMRLDGSGLGMLKITNDYAHDCQYNQGTGWDGTQLIPNDLSAFANQIQSIRFDDTRGIQVVFFHSYDTTTDANRYWHIFAEQEVIAR
jgi:hypothetical protein